MESLSFLLFEQGNEVGARGGGRLVLIRNRRRKWRVASPLGFEQGVGGRLVWCQFELQSD